MPNAAAATQPATKTMRQEQPIALKPGAFQGAEFARARFDAMMPSGIAFEEALKPSFWTNVVHLLSRNQLTNQPDRSGAFIDLGTEDHAFYAKLYVRAVGSNGLIVQCIGPSIDAKGRACPVDLATGLPWTGAQPVESDGFDIRWNLGKRGFDIIRKSDQQVIADGSNFKTREMALEWIEKTTKAV